MSYSRRELYAMGEPLGESVTRKEGGRTIYGGGGGGGPTSSTTNTSNIPDWLRPQVETVLGGSMQELFNTERVPGVDGGQDTYNITGVKSSNFQPYSANPRDYVAGFSPLQQQVQYNAANLQMPGQYSTATGLAGMGGMGGIESAQDAMGYGQLGAGAGQLGQQLGVQGGKYYGGMGAGYGAQAADLANPAQDYGQAGYSSGQIGQQLALNAANQYGGMGAGYGAQAAGLAPQAQQYGQNAANIGSMGLRAEELGQDITGQARNYAAQQAAAGQNYANQVTNPNAISAYMNPYQQNVIDIQNQAAQRQADIARTQRNAQAVKAGAFGGSRQAIENAEANRSLQSLMNNNQLQGQQQAYQNAIQNMQYGANLGLQGLGGAQSGLGTALQGGQLGLSGIGQAMAGQQAGLAGLGQAGSLYGVGMQGAGMGLQAAQTGLAGTAQGMQGAQSGLSGLSAANQAYQTGMQGAGMGLQGTQAQLAGTAQGMQGAGMGLQGVSGAQQGYGLANQAGTNLANIGSQQLGAQQGILGLQQQVGGQQQAQEQQIINQAIQNYANQQQAPMQAYNQYNALLRGYAIPGMTTTQYQAAPSMTSQIAGLGTAAAGAYGLMKRAGGTIKEPKGRGIDTLGLRNALNAGK